MIKSISFIEEIESLHIEKSIDYIDAVLMWSEKNNIEIDVIANFIKKDDMLRSKIQVEAENLNILKRGRSLPI